MKRALGTGCVLTEVLPTGVRLPRALRSASLRTGSTGLALVLALSLAAGVARAQDFAIPGALPSDGDLLERGLPGASGGPALTALDVNRPAGLATRALALAAGFHTVRAAAGLARTGDAELGWSTAAFALGFAGAGGGAAFRGALRRDDAAPAGETSLGAEVGGGGWIALGDARAWIAAPQAWLGGALPPLARGVTAGFDWRAAGGFAGLAREAPRRGFAEGALYTMRAGLSLGGLAFWTEVREDPLRGGVGVSADLGPFRCVAQVDAHPVLDTTTRLALTLRPGARER